MAMLHIDIRIGGSRKKKHKKNKAALVGEQLCFEPLIAVRSISKSNCDNVIREYKQCFEALFKA